MPRALGDLPYMKKLAYTITLLVSVVMLLSYAAPTFAQEGETATTTQPAGIGILILLMGILALLLVGGTYLAQNGSRKANAGAGSTAADDDDYDE